jgi:DNA polymerase-3 subunit beta
MQISENKIKFSIENMKLISKVIDGKFPDYRKVVPTNNDKTLIVASKDFISSIERVASVSIDRKEGVKLLISKDNVQLSVNSANSGDGNEKINAKFNSENLNISFNSKYLIDIASEVEDKNLKINLKDSVSPVLIEDVSDRNSYYVIMPMKI